ncbi:MAG: hypothetical protein COB86_07930 [Dehalococcoidia bacterium]|nr:MAG: hypothetical protein COB86_07930 [Dehalococcoidia bacterium]
METEIRFKIRHRETFADGESFGDTGQYERIAGEIRFAVDPDSDAYSMVVDLKHAPRNDHGFVEFATDFYILKPADLAQGNRRLLYDVNNRGALRMLQFFNDAVHSNTPSTTEHAGNGFLMRRGYSLVWSGWQGDIMPGDGRQTMRLPIATENGEEITGVTRSEFIVDEHGVLSMPLSANGYTSSYEAISTDTRDATFTMREYESDQRQPIADDDWAFARLQNGRPIPSAFHCHLPRGFKPGWIYELVYTAKNPNVQGLGLTGVRDLISFLLHDEADTDGTPNPLRLNGTRMEKAYGWGRSQSGRFLREFVYRGYNEDSQGRRVFDAISPHVSGGGRVVLNYRFAQPGRYPRPHDDHLYPSDSFPFAYSVISDPMTGKTDGILKRPDSDPLVIHTQTSSEYWTRRGSLVHTDSIGNDIPEHHKTRVFHFAGSQHNADPLGGNPNLEYARYRANPLNTTPLLRAVIDALDAWATDATPPPDSMFPRRSDETGVPADVAARVFPKIPNVEHPDNSNRLFFQNHGPEFDAGIASNEPPIEDRSREYIVLVPQVDADGNETPGIRTPHIQVPLATYTGWNYRPAGSAEQAIAGTTGGYHPLPVNRAQRDDTGDPRLSVEERYGSKARYVRLIALTAQRMVERRLLLEEDADRYVALAMEHDFEAI